MTSNISRKLDHYARRITVKSLRCFHPGRASKYTSQLKDVGITIKNKSDWKGQTGEIRQLVCEMRNSDLEKKLNSQKQRFLLTKDQDALAVDVMDAVYHAMLELEYKASMFPNPKTNMPIINLVVSSKYTMPMFMPNEKTMIFSKGYHSLTEGPQTKEQGWGIVKGTLSNLKLSLSDFRDLYLPHVNDVISAYQQIGLIYYEPRVKYSSEEVKKQEGFLRLFDPGVSGRRIKNNIRFLKEIYPGIPYKVILPTMIFHDLGKMNLEEEASHPEISVKWLEEDDSRESQGSYKKSYLLDDISWLIVKNSVRYHLVPGGISLGEYSLMSIYDIFEGKELSDIISSGRVNEFIDNLTLLTACDIAGQKKHIPMNRMIEDLAVLNRFLKGIFQKVIKKDKAGNKYFMDEEGRTRFHVELKRLAERASEIRLCRYLSSQDDNRDVNTNSGYGLYLKKLRNAFDEMNISRQDRESALKFFALLKSFPFSGAPLNRILWNNQEGSETGKKLIDLKISENAVLFLINFSKAFFLYLSDALLKKIEQEKDFIVTANLLKENGKPIRSVKKNNADIERFVKMISEGQFPTFSFHADEKTISINISLTEPLKRGKNQFK